MRRRWVVVFAAGAAALLGTGCAHATPAATTPMPSTTPVSTAAAPVPAAGGTAGSWRRAIEVPGLTALDKAGGAVVESASCGSAGNCAAGGYFTSHGRYLGFVVSERHGRWGQAIEVPGLGTLDAGAYPGDGGAAVSSLSCGSAGNCAAGGSYLDQNRNSQGFVVSETNGVWGRAIEVPGLSALNVGKDGRPGAGVNSVSCGSAGNCTAGGFYQDQRRHEQGFVVSETNGVWGRAIEVPGLGALNIAAYVAEGAEVTSVSCASAGNCSAGGYYNIPPADDRIHRQAFVAIEQHGRWGMAIEVPGISALNTGHYAEVSSVSCSSAGNCAAGGNYASRAPNINGGGHQQGFVVSETNGRWGQVIEVPGLGALNTHGDAGVESVSCASPGNCAAGGNYNGDPQYHDGYGKGYVVSEKNGAWGHAISAPGLRALHAGPYSDVKSVSCTSPGNCSAGGLYDASGAGQAFLVNENNGAWGRAVNIAGLKAMNKGGAAQVTSVSCVPAGSCVAGGGYRDSHNHFRAFVT
jgi:hypothetical protein